MAAVFSNPGRVEPAGCHRDRRLAHEAPRVARSALFLAAGDARRAAVGLIGDDAFAVEARQKTESSEEHCPPAWLAIRTLPPAVAITKRDC